MIEKKVRALSDFNFKNEMGFWILTSGEVLVLPFKNEQDFKEHLKSDRFELVGEDVPTGKNIQILHKKNASIPMENELLATLEHTGHLDKLDTVPASASTAKEKLITKGKSAANRKPVAKEKTVAERNPWVVT